MLDELKKKITDSSVLMAPVACAWFLLVIIASIPPLLLFKGIPSLAEGWENEKRDIVILSAIISIFLTAVMDSFIDFICNFDVVVGRLILIVSMFVLVLDLVYFYYSFNNKGDEPERQD